MHATWPPRTGELNAERTPRQIVTETTPRHATSTGPKEGLDTEVSLRTRGRSWNSSAAYCQQTVKSV
ncbi:hypothetical protein BN13_250041 [Nostocoides jenkinsii Ben 74]|uniref:Uncharacterized protein n=1 Tax=Nostocoides jenkinsii Ben 74 TaxID=1193518 RepID=A0A077MDT7_9MICO|nr:hypothetical protein BN13_250041 [Tetrasphaera jenkinsii Ben 74]